MRTVFIYPSAIIFLMLSQTAGAVEVGGIIGASYACLGLDGIPISDTALAAQCCDGSGNLRPNSPDSCRTSLYGAGTSEATSGTGSNLHTAQETMDTVHDISGAGTDYSTPTPISQAGSSGTGSAITASTGGSAGTGTDSTGSGTGIGAGTGAGSGAGSDGAGSGSGSGSGGVGTTTGNTKSKTGDATAEAKGEDGAGRYQRVGGEGDGAGGKAGGLFGSLFGSDSLKFGEGGNAAGAGKDDLNGGSAVDPSDYFNRIDKSASIFKVVSNRYAKETERKHIGIPEMTK